MESRAQSVSTMAPTTTPAATIPLVCALAGNGMRLAHVLATVAVLLVAWCIGRFASYSASPGSLYRYASIVLPPWLRATVAWSLLLAYVATGSSVIGGFSHYANPLLRDATGHRTSAVLLAVVVTVVSMGIAYRDVKISARLMLWIEASSVLVILTLVTLILLRHGPHWDWDQLQLRGTTGSGLRLGLVLALFSFVGFESATTLGAEAQSARNHSASGDSQRPSGRSVFQRLCLRGTSRLPHCGAGPGHKLRADAGAGRRGRLACAGPAD
jgi:amino acid transporter